MPRYLVYLFALAAFALAGLGTLTHQLPGSSLPQAAAANAIDKAVLGQGASALAPDRVLLLQRRTFAPGSDSGAHPAPGPTVLYVDSGAVEFTVTEGAALLTRKDASETTGIAAGEHVSLQAGDSVFYDEGVVHDVANPNTDPGVTLEARFNPAEPQATPAP